MYVKNENNEGENIEEDDVNFQKTMSFIKTKPSMAQNNFLNEEIDYKKGSITNMGIMGKINGVTARDKTRNSHRVAGSMVLDQTINYDDKYLTEMLQRFEKQVAGFHEGGNDEQKIVDIQIQMNYPLEVQVLTTEGASSL